MILLDYSQVCISSMFYSVKSLQKDEIDKEFLKGIIYNSIRYINKKFRNEFGELVIAIDSKNSWRKQFFPYYKAVRKTNREDSPVNWDHVYEIMAEVKQELIDNFPYKVLEVTSAEADDIIGTLVHAYGNTKNKILIVSEDKDFLQLHVYDNVFQYYPIKEKYAEAKADTKRFLFEHIVKGETGDGIPNIFSPDDCFITKTRQTPVTQKNIDIWVNQTPEESFKGDALKKYYRNETLVNLSKVPSEIRREILTQHETYIPARGKVMKFLIENDMNELLKHVSDF